MIVCLILAIVLAIAGNGLISLTSAGYRSSAMVAEEQGTASAMAQLGEDIRDATAISFQSGASPSDQVELTESSSASTAPVILWIYDPVAGTLTRQSQVGGSWVNSGFVVTKVINTAAQPVFTYYDATTASIPAGATPPLPASDQSALEINSTAIGVDIHVTGAVPGTPAYHFSNEVTMTNVANANQPAGEGV